MFRHSCVGLGTSPCSRPQKPAKRGAGGLKSLAGGRGFEPRPTESETWATLDLIKLFSPVSQPCCNLPEKTFLDRSHCALVRVVVGEQVAVHVICDRDAGMAHDCLHALGVHAAFDEQGSGRMPEGVEVVERLGHLRRLLVLVEPVYQDKDASGHLRRVPTPPDDVGVQLDVPGPIREDKIELALLEQYPGDRGAERFVPVTGAAHDFHFPAFERGGWQGVPAINPSRYRAERGWLRLAGRPTMNAPASTAAMRGVHSALSDIEDDVHRVVGLVQALMLMGFGAHMNDVPAEAILTLGEAMLGAAESVRDQWRGAIELTRTAETEAVSAADMAMPPDPASLGRIRAIVHERLQAAEGGRG
jgi:hypothetical protein